MRLISAGSGVQVPAPAPSFLYAGKEERKKKKHKRKDTEEASQKGPGREDDERKAVSSFFFFVSSFFFFLFPMRQLPDRVLQTIRRRGLIPRGGRVVAAVSGGPDSVAMLTMLRELQPKGEFALAGIAHFNHRLRGEDSDADEAFCRALAAGLGLEFRSEAADVAGRA